jgi:hypothetical protein
MRPFESGLSRRGCPAQVKRSEKKDDVGIIRIDYLGYSGRQFLEKISWDEFFEKFEESKLAFIYQDEWDSRFSKLVKRNTVNQKARKNAPKKSQRSRSSVKSQKKRPKSRTAGRASGKQRARG